MGAEAAPRRGRAAGTLVNAAGGDGVVMGRQADKGTTPAVYTAGVLAAKFGVSKWLIYDTVRRGDFPVAPIKIGHRLVWPKAAIDRLLGLDEAHR